MPVLNQCNGANTWAAVGFVTGNPPGGAGAACSTSSPYLAPNGTIYTCVGGFWTATNATSNGTGFPVISCNPGDRFYATDTNQVWTCDQVGVWQNSTTGVTSSGNTEITAGVLATYPMLTCAGAQIPSTTVPECSGNGRDGTFATGGSPNFGAAPTAISTGLNFNGGQAFNTMQFFSIPIAAYNGAQTIIVYYQPTTGGAAPSALSQTLMAGTSQTPSNGFVTFAAGDGAPAIGTDGIPNYIGASQLWRGIMPLTVTQCNTTGHGYYQGTEWTGYRFQATVAPISGSTAAFVGGDVGPYIDPLVGNLYYLKIFSGCLTQAQINSETARINVILNGRGLALGNTLNNSNRFVVADGTSITEGYYTGGAGVVGGTSNYIAKAAALLDSSYQIINNGISGQTLTAALAKIQTTDISQITNRQSPIVIPDFPTNDLLGSAGSVATAEANIQSFCAAVHAIPGALCIPTTVLPCTSGACSVTFSANRAAWNLWLRANWSTFSDAMADAANDSTIGPDAAASNTTCFPDGHHPGNTVGCNSTTNFSATTIAAPYYALAISRAANPGSTSSYSFGPFVPATGGTITGNNYPGTENIEIEPAGTISTLTVNLEFADTLPIGSVKNVTFSQIVSTLTMAASAAGGGTINGASIAVAAANTSIAYSKTGSKTWRRLY